MSWVQDLLGRFPPLRKVVDYRLVEKESLHHCPACKADVHANSTPFARLDRYGFPVITHWCQCCDLLYINPRPTPDAYKKFYDSGDYRRLITAFSGHEDDHLLPQARVMQLASMLKAHVPNRPLSVLNIGGTRADYEVLLGHISMGRYVCLNPGEEEAGEGYEVLPHTLETYSPQGDVFDVVCLLGTLNHLTEPGAAFGKIARMMTPDSIFVFDYKDPLAKMARMTQPIGGLQFDHATYPTRRTLGVMMRAAGLGLQTWHTDNQRLFTFIAAQDPGAALPDILAVNESSVIDGLRHRARRLPRRLSLQVLGSMMGANR
jgi:hypothetical protein